MHTKPPNRPSVKEVPPQTSHSDIYTRTWTTRQPTHRPDHLCDSVPCFASKQFPATTHTPHHCPVSSAKGTAVERGAVLGGETDYLSVPTQRKRLWQARYTRVLRVLATRVLTVQPLQCNRQRVPCSRQVLWARQSGKQQIDDVEPTRKQSVRGTECCVPYGTGPNPQWLLCTACDGKTSRNVNITTGAMDGQWAKPRVHQALAGRSNSGQLHLRTHRHCDAQPSDAALPSPQCFRRRPQVPHRAQCTLAANQWHACPHMHPFFFRSFGRWHGGTQIQPLPATLSELKLQRQ